MAADAATSADVQEALIDLIAMQLRTAQVALDSLHSHIAAGNRPELVTLRPPLQATLRAIRQARIDGLIAGQEYAGNHAWRCPNPAGCDDRPEKAICTCLVNCGAEGCEGVL